MENNFDNVFCELNLSCDQFPDSNVTVWIDMFKKRLLFEYVLSSHTLLLAYGV